MVKSAAFSMPALDSLIREKTVFKAEVPCILGKELHIGYGIDALFAHPAGVSITSIAANNPHMKLNFHILASSIREEDLNRFRRLAEMYPNIIIYFYHLDNGFFADFPTMPEFSLAIYYRLILPLLLQGATDRLVYLDADIICGGAINELAEMDLGEYIIFAVRDSDRTVSKRINALQLKNNSYFNSGVLLINISRWQSHHVLSEAVKLLSSTKAGDFGFPDQDALNLALDGRAGFLERKWNFMIGLKDMPIPPSTVFIHFYCRPKPWNISYEGPNQHFYSRYMSLSPWADVPLQMPATYREMRLYAEQLFRKKLPGKSLRWYMKYLVNKIAFKLKLSAT